MEKSQRKTLKAIRDMYKNGNMRITNDMYVEIDWLVSQEYLRKDAFKIIPNSGKIFTCNYIQPLYPLTDKGLMALNVVGKIILFLRHCLEVFRLIKPV